MLPTSFWSVFLAFLVGQAAAWIYLRTGRLLLGILATACVWILFDWWLLVRYVFAADADTLGTVAGLLQATAIWIALWLAFGRWRRRWSAAARSRTERFAAGMAQYLRRDHAAARATFTGLVRTDPWDAAAWIALGDVFARAGAAARARRCYRRARAVDIQGQYADLIERGRLLPASVGRERTERRPSEAADTRGSPSATDDRTRTAASGAAPASTRTHQE